MRNRIRLVSVAALTVVIALGASACGSPPWEAQSTAGPDASASPTATATITPVVNDLATGSALRTLQAGAVALTVEYNSPLRMDQWTAGANKPLKVKVTATLGQDDGQKIFLSRVTVTPAVQGPDGTLPAPAQFVDQSVVSPGNYIKSPYSYELTYIIPALDPSATSLTLGFAYDVLLQTTPTSSEYAKQSAYDTLTIAIAP